LRVSIVVAAAENGVIGSGGEIPWRLPDDQKLFKRLTVGHTLVMGRGTHESIGRLLPDRTTIVVSRRSDYTLKGAWVAGSVEAALDLARGRGESELFVVGGESIYARALPLAHDLYVTRVHAELDGDVHFPDPADGHDPRWKLVESSDHAADIRHSYAFTFQHWERDGANAERPPARTLSELCD
jgi:dihydrofolate reductase